MPTALICIAEAVVVLSIGMGCDMAKSILGIKDGGTELMVFLGMKLAVQFVFGAGIFFCLAYLFRLEPMCEYAKMGAGAMKGRWPKVADILERRLGT